MTGKKNIQKGLVVIISLLIISVAGYFSYQQLVVNSEKNELLKIDQYFFSGQHNKYREAIAAYEKYAKQGNAHANAMLARYYMYGMGVKPDEKKAKEYYALAKEEINRLAGKGDPVYQDLLGDLVLNLESNEKAAFTWFKLAAKQGYHSAQYNLAICYANGTGVKEDPEQAVYWYRLAAEQGDTDAMQAVGDLYENGTGVKKDYGKAMQWYRKSAEKNNSYAQYSIGDMYAGGTGVSRDYNKAVEWFTKAANNGNDEAQMALGKMYERGRGVTKNLMKALQLYKEALKAGNEDAQGRISRVLRKMAREAK